MPQNPKRLVLIVAAVFCVRFLLGLILINGMAPISVDDYYRVFYAAWWWEHIGFASSYVWLPGHHYVYGTVVGLCQDTIFAPRLLTLIFHLGTGLLLFFLKDTPTPAKWIGALVIWFMPLSFSIGTVPYAEAGFFFFIIANGVFTSRYVNSRSVFDLFIGSISLLAASAFRYEGWIFIPIFMTAVLPLPPRRISRAVHWLLSGLPGWFPLVWILFCRASQNEWFAFLRSTKEDHFGQGHLVDTITGPLGILCLIQLVLVAGLRIHFAISGKNKRVTEWIGRWRAHLWEIYAFVALGFIVLLVIWDGLPSQYPVRVFYSVLIFMAVPVAFQLNRMRRNWYWWAIGVGFALFSGFGFWVVFHTPLGIQPENYLAGRWIGHQYHAGELEADDHVVISHELPDCAALYVFANKMGTIHLDAMGDKCPPQLLLPFENSCPVPSWASEVQLAMVRRGSMEEEMVRYHKWRKERVFGQWVAYRRKGGTAVPLNRKRESVMKVGNDQWQ